MKTVLYVAALAALIPVAGHAATSPQDLCPKGQLVTVRVSGLKPDGTKAGFDKAVADNQAWYVAHGMTKNKQIGGTVLNFDSKTGWTEDKDKVATIHTDPPMTNAGPRDDAWKAFVAEYDANSTISQQVMICLDRPIR